MQPTVDEGMCETYEMAVKTKGALPGWLLLGNF
jgi:hypothetical protein